MSCDVFCDRSATSKVEHSIIKEYMKKTIGLVLLFFACSQSDIKNDLTKMGLKGSVSKVVVTEYKAVEKFGEIEKGDVISTDSFLFNKYGYLIEKDESLIFNMKTKLKYDEKNKLIERNEYNSKGELMMKTTFKYDTNDNIIEELKYDNNDELITKSVLKYDKSVNTITKTTYKKDNSVQDSVITKYNSNNLELEQNDFFMYTRYVSTYSDKNELSLFAIYSGSSDSKPTLSEKTVFKYDDYDQHGNWLKRNSLYGSETSNFKMKPEKIQIREITYY